MYARSSGCVYAVQFRCSASPGRAFMSASIASNHVQESVPRDPVRRSVGHELARKDWSMRAHSIGLLFIDNLCPLVRVPHAIL